MIGIGSTPFGADILLTDEEFGYYIDLSSEAQCLYRKARIEMMRQSAGLNLTSPTLQRLEYQETLKRAEETVRGNLSGDDWHIEDGYAWKVDTQ